MNTLNIYEIGKDKLPEIGLRIILLTDYPEVSPFISHDQIMTGVVEDMFFNCENPDLYQGDACTDTQKFHEMMVGDLDGFVLSIGSVALLNGTSWCYYHEMLAATIPTHFPFNTPDYWNKARDLGLFTITSVDEEERKRSFPTFDGDDIQNTMFGVTYNNRNFAILVKHYFVPNSNKLVEYYYDVKAIELIVK